MPPLVSRLVVLCIVVLLVGASVLAKEEPSEEWRFSDLRPCALTTLEMAQTGEHENFDPCILYNLEPEEAFARSNHQNNRSVVVNLVMVTDARCEMQRDGAYVGVEQLNKDNNGQGVAIGFHEDFYVRFRYFSVVVGNKAYLGDAEYDRLHKLLLDSMLETFVVQRQQYTQIVGTCSWASRNEKEVAKKYQTILMAQVGPPSYYQEENPWVFGFHLNSDEYPTDAARRLQFLAASEEGGPSKQPVRVIYRSTSEFFYSTCRSAIDTLTQAGFTDLIEVLYDPAGDDDNDGTANQFDHDFLNNIADQACPPGSSTDNNNATDDSQHLPAIFICTLTEQEILLQRFRENGCRFRSLWLTAATWQWANANPDVVPYFQGGGQWHRSFQYSDKYFESGQEVIHYNREKFGYEGIYDVVVSYAITLQYAQHLQTLYRVLDHPDPLGTFLDPTGREFLRRQMLNMKSDSIFGPISFDKNQRNVGRGAAASQWLPVLVDSDSDSVTIKSGYSNALVSPIAHAEAAAVIPAYSAADCEPGYFINNTLILTEPSLLSSKCSPCPANTITSTFNSQLQCNACPKGSFTRVDDGIQHWQEGGQTECIRYDDNLLAPWMLGFGYVAAGLSWFLGFFFIGWIIYYREDPIVNIAQTEFLLLICIGGIISTSTIVVLSFQAQTGEDTTAASRACASAPFLYSLGWCLQYASLSAKTLRLYKVVETKRFTRITVSAQQSSWIILLALAIDFAIVTAWTILAPLHYEREVTGQDVDNGDGVITIESIGRCRPTDGDKFWVFAGPLFTNHLLLMCLTHFLLYRVRNIHDRYQEQKYIGMAAVFSLEVAFIGLPILFAAQESVEASFFVMVGIVALDNIGVLSFIFIPKVYFQRQGLADGVGVGESILRESHENAVIREKSRELQLYLSKRDAALAVSLRQTQKTELGDSSTSIPILDLPFGAIEEVEAETSPIVTSQPGLCPPDRDAEELPVPSESCDTGQS